MMVFGPVPSRRLGRSLGINNIPAKHCSYSCIYCQLGNSNKTYIKRKPFYNPEDIFADVQEIIKKSIKKGINIDFITFVPSGEPTFDVNLGKSIDLLKLLGYKIAIISNSSLIWIDDVRNDIKKADWVSLKVDTVDEKIWRKINQPNKMLRFSSIINGLKTYSKNRNFVTESMIVNKVNSNENHIHELAEFIAKLNPDTAYISIPVRPPANKNVKKPDEIIINKIYQIFSHSIPKVELLIDFEENSFTPISDIENDILRITSVHPLKEDFLNTYLEKANSDWHIIERMIKNKILLKIPYDGYHYYLRSIKRN